MDVAGELGSLVVSPGSMVEHQTEGLFLQLQKNLLAFCSCTFSLASHSRILLWRNVNDVNGSCASVSAGNRGWWEADGE